MYSCTGLSPYFSRMDRGITAAIAFALARYTGRSPSGRESWTTSVCESGALTSLTAEAADCPRGASRSHRWNEAAASAAVIWAPLWNSTLVRRGRVRVRFPFDHCAPVASTGCALPLASSAKKPSKMAWVSFVTTSAVDAMMSSVGGSPTCATLSTPPLTGVIEAAAAVGRRPAVFSGPVIHPPPSAAPAPRNNPVRSSRRRGTLESDIIHPPFEDWDWGQNRGD